MKRLNLFFTIFCFIIITKTFAQNNKEFFTAMQLGIANSEYKNYKTNGLNISFDKTYGNYEFGLITNTYLRENINDEYNLPNQKLNFYTMDIGMKIHRLIFKSKSSKSSLLGGLINGLSASQIFKGEADGMNYVFPPKYGNVLLSNSYCYFISPSINLEYVIIKNKLAIYNHFQYKFLFGNTSFSNTTDLSKFSMSFGVKLLL